MNNDQVLKLFFETQLKNDSKKVLNALVELQPINLTLDNILHLYSWIKENYSVKKYEHKHINIFGTGGDKTVNISTMSSILASNFIDVIKIGTRAVTSKWGSMEFMNCLYSSEGRDLAFYSDKSRYINLGELGYQYSADLISARKQLRERDILDIYKLVFPPVNYTGSVSQINGVHKIEYLNYYIHIFKSLKINGLIIYNDNDIDEIFFGRNYLFLFSSGQLISRKVIDIQCNSQTDFDYFQESDNIENHVQKLGEIKNRLVNDSVQKVIFMNVAVALYAYHGFTKTLDQCYEIVQTKAFG